MATKIIAVPLMHAGVSLSFDTIGDAMKRFGFQNPYKFKIALEDGRPVYTLPGDPAGGGRAYILDEALD